MGGDRLLLPAAARRARRGARAGDALRHAGARRPARGARRARALPRLPARDPPGLARARPAGGDAGRARGAGVLRGALRVERGGAGARRPRGADGGARDVDLLGHARDPAAAGHRRGDPGAARDGHRRPSGPLGRVGRRASGCRSARTRRGSTRCSRRRACTSPASTSPTSRPAARAPLRSPAGPLLVPLDRPALELVWSREGYPSRGAYRDTHRLTERRHQAWAVDGAAYEPERAAAQARADAAAFVAAVQARSGLCCVAWDTELLGLHWHEGVLFLAAVLEEAEAAGLRIAPLDVLAAEAEAAAGGARRRDLLGRPAHPGHLERAARRRAGVAPAPRRAAHAPGRLAARDPGAAGAAVLRLGVPDRARHGGRLPARAGRRSRGRAGGRARGAGGARDPRARANLGAAIAMF